MHLVETMAYTGERPWHDLGNQLAPQQPIEVWKKQAGMDWEIEESEVRYITGSNNVGVINAFPEQKVLYRSDTKAPLAVVSKRFQVVQPGEILEFYRDLTACNGLELETAGVLREGRKFWALAKTGQSATLNGAFEELEEDVPAVVEEFYPPTGETGVEHDKPKDAPASLRGRLQEKIARVGGA